MLKFKRTSVSPREEETNQREIRPNEERRGKWRMQRCIELSGSIVERFASYGWFCDVLKIDKLCFRDPCRR